MFNTVLKLSNNSRLAIPNNPLPTYALFEDTVTREFLAGAYQWDAELETWTPPSLRAGLTSFGSNPDGVVTLVKRNLLADMSGNQRTDIPDLPLSQILVHHILGSLADPTGLTRAKPLVMTRRNGNGVHFGTYGRIQFGAFEINSQHPNFQAILDVAIADYRRMVATGVAKQSLRKYVGSMMLAVYRRLSDDFRDDFVPPEERSPIPSDDYLDPNTPITDSFDRADSAALGSSSEGWSWTEVSGGTDIVSNAAKATSSTGYNRAETDLSGADMYAQANSINDVDGAGRGCGAAVRYAPGADTCYWHKGVKSTTITTHELMERTAGTDVTHSSTGGYTDANGGVHRVEINGSDIELFYDGSSRHTASDSSITGNLRSGICGRHTGTNRLRWDNFSAEALGAAAITTSRAVLVS